MHQRLKHIADITFGLHVLRSEIERKPAEIKYLNGGHFDQNSQPSKFHHSYLAPNKRIKKYLLQHQDVLLAGKGYRNFAWTYHEDFGPSVPSSMFYVIRANSSIILPEYLTLILNTHKIQDKLRLTGLGVAIPSIPKTELKEIKIPIPSIERQKKLIEIAKLHQREINLTKQILQKKTDIFNAFINSV